MIWELSGRGLRLYHRPMTLGEVRKYVRGLDEWQQSSQGTDSARALSFAIGRVFGEVA